MSVTRSAHYFVSIALAVTFGGQLVRPSSAAADSTSAAPRVAVSLISGRTFQGAVDPRTDEGQLWLRFGGGELTILRPIAWTSITRVVHADNEYTAADFRPLAEELKQQTPRAVFANAVKNLVHQAPDTHFLPPPQVRQFHIDAYVANWDHDPEVDGVVIHLFTLCDDGLLAPVAGTLEATLVGRRANPAETSVPFPQLGRWTMQVQPEHFGPAGAIYRLPFQAVHPDFDFRVGAEGLLNARLIVPGTGTFEASAATLRIRPYSGLRDRLQQESGRRFFSVERTGRTH